MKSTKKKAIESKEIGVVFTNGRLWKAESLESYRDYQVKYVKQTYRTFVFRLQRVDEKEMIDYLEGKENLSEYIKGLITKEMAKSKKQ